MIIGLSEIIHVRTLEPEAWKAQTDQAAMDFSITSEHLQTIISNLF